MRLPQRASVEVELPPGWSGPPDPVAASELAAALAVRQLRPRSHHREDVWASARAHAWELLAEDRAPSWPALRVAARHRALATARALAHWLPETEARRGGFGADGSAPMVTMLDPTDPAWGDRARGALRTFAAASAPGEVPAGDDGAGSPALRRLQITVERIIAELADRGLDATRARELVEVVIEHPEIRRGAGRARRRLVGEGLAEVSAAALVALVLGYPTRGVPGIIEREVRGRDGWSHPCVPRLLDLIAHPRGTRVRGVWQEPLPEAS